MADTALPTATISTRTAYLNFDITTRGGTIDGTDLINAINAQIAALAGNSTTTTTTITTGISISVQRIDAPATVDMTTPIKCFTEDEDCPICRMQYDELEDWEEVSSSHEAVSTVCGHVFGHACLKTWLHDHNTCPNCRRVLYEMKEEVREEDEDGWTDDGERYGSLRYGGVQVEDEDGDQEDINDDDDDRDWRQESGDEERLDCMTIRDNNHAAELFRADRRFATMDLESRQRIWETMWRQTEEDVVRDWRDQEEQEEEEFLLHRVVGRW